MSSSPSPSKAGFDPLALEVRALTAATVHPAECMADLQTLPDELLLLFLRDEKGDVNRAAQRTAETLAWRRSFGVHELLQDVEEASRWQRFYRIKRHLSELPPPPPRATATNGAELIINHYWPAAILGHAFDDTVVQVTRLSCIDWKTVVRSRELLPAAVRYSVHLNELARLLRAGGEMTMIFDCGASAYERVAGVETPFEPMAAMFFFAEIGRVLRRHYPFAIKRVILTRAPAALAHPYAAARVFMPRWAYHETHIFADEASGFLSKLMPQECIPTCLGGRGGIIEGGGMLADAPPACIPFELPWARTGKRALWQPGNPAQGLTPAELEEVDALATRLESSAEHGACSVACATTKPVSSPDAAGGAAQLQNVASSASSLSTLDVSGEIGREGVWALEDDADARRTGELVERATLISDHKRLCEALEMLRVAI